MSEPKETVKTERCPECGSENFKVHHFLRQFRHDRVYLECAECGHFTARMIIHAYVDPHPDKNYERFLKDSIRYNNVSGRKTLDDHIIHAERASDQFSHVKDLIAEKKEKGIEEDQTIEQLLVEYQITEDK